MMMRKAPISLMTVAMWLAAASVRADVVYNVVPYTLSGGYAIAGGMIATNDAMDTIIAWNVEVTGALPYTFSNTNPGATLYPNAFVISPTAITIVGDNTAGTGFEAHDNTDPDWTDCTQSLYYILFGPAIQYTIFDSADGNPDVSSQYSYNTGPITIATVVPEPTSLALLGLGGLIAMLRRQKQTA
ncbi:MAG: PEP-CTERM sorting domain-containing protein [Phycisphaera sp.]|nr:PEP-CTERM sorting domain-containing protein [Phycisphaera sp.]